MPCTSVPTPLPLQGAPLYGIQRCCRVCEVMWIGSVSSECWMCGVEGVDGPLRRVIFRVPPPGDADLD